MKDFIRLLNHGNKVRYLSLLIFVMTSCLSNSKSITTAGQLQQTGTPIKETIHLPIMMTQASQGCSSSRLGSILFTEATSGESTGPYLEALAQEGYTGMAGTPTYDMGAQYFGKLPGWERAFICNSHDCLEQRAERSSAEGLAFEYLAYDPERQGGVPDEEKYNLPWATQVAREIADKWNKPLMISYSTKQLHQEAEERGYDWNDPSQVVALLAPYGDVWMIQAADEYWRLEDNTVRPILSQRVYPPGDEFRAQVQRWVGWIRAANPDIKIWIQLGLQRIGVEGENEPSADLLLAYGDSILDLVDGIYMTPIYGSIEQFPVANQEMVEVFHRACPPQAASSETAAPSAPLQPAEVTGTLEPTRIPDTLEPSSITENLNINLVEEGWTDDVEIPCSPSGDCLTILPGYYYQIYENTQYPCGTQGNHQFFVLDRENNPSSLKNLFVKFPGGAVGFYYLNENNARVYYPNPNASGLLTASYFRNLFFRTGVSEEYSGGVTRKFRENDNFRILIPSYCSHDFYLGAGQHDPVDGFSRWGYQAAMAAVDFVQQQFNSAELITYGGSSGAAGAFYIGKDQDNVAAIIMDSQAADLSAIRDACYDGLNVFGNSYPCFCPDGGPTCMEVLAPRIGFAFSEDEPYQVVQSGFDVPIYYVWNERDASIYAHLQFERLHEALTTYNPGGDSVANMVCITDPRTPPGPVCNLHVPSAFDFPETKQLVTEIYSWALSRISDALGFTIQLPLLAN